MARLEDAYSLGKNRLQSAYGSLDHSSQKQPGKEQSYVDPWGKNNPFYAEQAWNTPSYQTGNVYTDAAIRSGVVNRGGYGAAPTQAELNARAQTGSSRHAGFMGHIAGSGGGGRVIHSMLRFRRSGIENRSTGWKGLLTQSTGPNKSFGLGGSGRGQSSEDSTKEMYSTIETRMGTRAQFTDETWNEAKTKFGRTWAGYKRLGSTGNNPYISSGLGRMYKRENTNVGFARRVKR